MATGFEQACSSSHQSNTFQNKIEKVSQYWRFEKYIYIFLKKVVIDWLKCVLTRVLVTWGTSLFLNDLRIFRWLDWDIRFPQPILSSGLSGHPGLSCNQWFTHVKCDLGCCSRQGAVSGGAKIIFYKVVIGQARYSWKNSIWCVLILTGEKIWNWRKKNSFNYSSPWLKKYVNKQVKVKNNVWIEIVQI